jgi:sugar lactone lactonase YvrE
MRRAGVWLGDIVVAAVLAGLWLPVPAWSQITIYTGTNPPGLSVDLVHAGTGPFTLTVRGSGFTAASVVKLGGTGLATSFINSQTLTATVPAALLKTIGPQAVTVVDGANVSNPVNLRITYRGDANADFSVNNDDAVQIALSVGGLVTPAVPVSFGDLNLSGTINIADGLTDALFAGGALPNLPTPSITSSSAIASAPASPGNAITVTGTGFSATAGNNIVFFSSAGGFIPVAASGISPGSNSQTLTVTVPGGAVSGPVFVKRQDLGLPGQPFVISISGSAAPLYLSRVTPLTGIVAGTSSLTVTGSGFDPLAANNTVNFKNAGGNPIAIPASTVNAGTTTLTVTVPAGAVSGFLTVTRSGNTSNPKSILISGTSTPIGIQQVYYPDAAGESVLIEGTGFNPSMPSDNQVFFTDSLGNDVASTVVMAGRTELVVLVPVDAVTGNLKVKTGGGVLTSNSITYTTLGGNTALVKISGDGQTGEAGTLLSNSLIVEARDMSGSPKAGVPVTFAVSSGSGSVSVTAAQVTGADGRAEVRASLGPEAATQNFTASVPALPPVTFAETATLTPSAIAIVSGNNQSAPPSKPLSVPLKVRVNNIAGLGVPGVAINWAATSGGGSVSTAQTATDITGQAQVTASVGAFGTNTYTATAPNAGLTAVVFAATAQTLAVSNIIFVDPASNAPISEIIVQQGSSASFQLKVFDNSGNPQQGVAVTYTSTNTAVATVDANGGVQGITPGFSTLLVNAAGVPATATITVVQVTPAAGTTPATSVAQDLSGNLYLVAGQNQTILQASGITQTPTIYAGENQTAGFINTGRLQSLFSSPSFVAVDQSSGVLYVSDSGNHVIRRVNPGAAGTVETFAGIPGVPGYLDTAGAQAKFNNPQGIALDGIGNLWVVDQGNQLIRRINLQTTMVDTIAGQYGTPGTADGVKGQNQFNYPRGIALVPEVVDQALDRFFRNGAPPEVSMVVADTGSNTVRHVSADGTVTTLVGPTGQVSSLLAAPARSHPKRVAAPTSSDAASSALSGPAGIAVDPLGNIYVSEAGTGLVKTVLRTGNVVLAAPANTFTMPQGIAIGSSGSLLVASSGNSAKQIKFGAPEIDSIMPLGVANSGGEQVTVTGKNFAPDTVVVEAGVLALNVQIQNTETLTFTTPPAASGLNTLTIANRGGVAQKAIVVNPAAVSDLPPGYITTVAGGSTFVGDGGDATQAEIRQPSGLALDTGGNVYIADSGHFSVRKVDARTGIITTVAGDGRQPNIATGTAINVLALASELTVRSIAIDAAGNLIVSGGLDNGTYKIDAGSGIITPVGINSADFLAVDGMGDLFYKQDPSLGGAVFKLPVGSGTPVLVTGTLPGVSGIVANGAGDLFIADSGLNQLFRVDHGTGNMTPYAGTGSAIFSGDGGAALSAGLEHPAGLAMNAAGDLYTIEASGRIRRVDAATKLISTVIQLGYAPQTTQTLPTLQIDGAGNLYVPSEDGKSVSKIDPRTLLILTVAGRPDRLAEGVPAVQARFINPTDVAIDSAGDLVIVDTGDRRIRKVSQTDGTIATVAGNGNSNSFILPPTGQPAAQASFYQPTLVAADPDRNVYFTDYGANSGQRIVWKVDASTGALSNVLTVNNGYPIAGLAVGAGGQVYYAAGTDQVLGINPNVPSPSPVAGDGQWGHSGDGGLAVLAQLAQPQRLHLDSLKQLFIAEHDASSVRKVDTSNIITTQAGGPGIGFPNTNDVAVDSSGNIYILTSDSILRVDAVSGIVSTIAYREYGVRAPLGDNGPSINAGLGAAGIAVDTSGNLYVADDANNRIRVIKTPPAPPTEPPPSGQSCTPISANVGKNGSLTMSSYISANRPGSYANCYTFMSTAGDQVSISVTSGAIDTYLYLLNGSNQLVAASSPPVGHAGRIPAIGSFVLPRTGAYTIEVAGSSSASLGSYTLNLSANALPTISSISPTSAIAGATITLAVTGTNFSPGTTLAVSGAGVSVLSVSITDPGTLSAILSFSAGAAPGPRTVTATSIAGTSQPATFNVIPQAPTITSLTPGSASPGTTITATITGTNFVPGGTTVSVSGTGVKVTSLNVVSPQQMTATLVLDSTAATGLRSLTASTAGGTSNSVSFNVVSQPTTLVSISPASAAAGSTLTLNLTGTNFVAGSTSVVISGSGIALGPVNVASSTSLSVSVTTVFSAATGARNVSVTTPNGTSNTVPFTITAAPPPTCTPITYGQTVNGSLTSSSRLSQDRAGSFADCYTFSGTFGDRIVITMNSSAFATYLYLLDANKNVVAAASGSNNSRLPAVGGFTLSASGSYSIDATSNVQAAVGSYSLSISVLPTLNTITPPFVAAGTTTPVTLSGAQFGSPMTASIGTGTVTNVNVVNSNSATASITEAAGVTGTTTVAVTTSTGTSAPVSLRVFPSIQTINLGDFLSRSLGLNAGTDPIYTFSPADLYQLTLNATTAVTVDMRSSAFSPQVNLYSSTGSFMSFGSSGAGYSQVSQLLGAGTYYISASSLFSSANGAYTLSINVLPALTSIVPTFVVAGTATNMTLSGARFGAPMTINLGSGTVSNLNILNAASATATVNIPAGQAGLMNVTVSTPAGTSNPQPLSVFSSIPQINPGDLKAGSLGPGDGANPLFTYAFADLYQLSLIATTTVTIDMRSGDFSPLCYLLSSSGSLLRIGVSGPGYSQITGTLGPGTYYIDASSNFGNTSGAYTLSINVLPALTGITPGFAVAGTPMPVTLSGARFGAPLTVSVGSGFVSNIALVNSNSATATITIPAGTPAGTTPVTVTTPISTSNQKSISVFASALAINPGDTITGSLAANGAKNPFSTGSSADLYQLTLNATTQVTIDMSSAAFSPQMWLTTSSGVFLNVGTTSPGDAQISMMLSAGTYYIIGSSTPSFATGTYTISINVVPALTSINPSFAAAGTSVPVTLTGVRFGAPMTVTVGSGASSNITVTNVNVLSSTSASATVNVPAGTPSGRTPLIATSPLGSTNSVSFFVFPSIVVINPGDTLAGSLDSSDGTNPFFGSSAFADLYQLTLATPTTVTIDMRSAAFNPRLSLSSSAGSFLAAGSSGAGYSQIATTLAAGTYYIPASSVSPGATGAYTISINVLPALASISTAFAAAGTSVPVTLTGARLGAPMTVIAGTGAFSNMSVSNVNVVSSTLATLTINVPAGTPSGGTTVTATTPAGTTNSLSFFVFPSIAAISPGNTVPGSLAPGDGTNIFFSGNPADLYQLTLNTTTTTTIDMKSSAYSPQVYLLSPSGSIMSVGVSGSGDSQLTTTLSAGTYYILATSYSPSPAGAYTLSVNN